VKKNDPAIQIPLTTGESINSLPSDSLFLNYDVESVKKMGFVPKEFESYMTGQMTWNIGKRDLLKNDLMQLEMIAQNNWKRPIYFAGTLANDNYLNLKDYMQLEGYAYRLLPVKVSQGDDGFANTEVMYNNMMKKMAWRGMDNQKVYYDSETYLKVPIITARLAFLRLVDQLVREDKKAKAKEVLDYANKVLPDNVIPYDQLCTNYVMYYFEVGDSKKAMEIAEILAKRAEGNLAYFTQKANITSAEWMPDNVQSYIQISLRNLQVIGNICSRNKQEEAAKRYEAIYNKYYSRVAE
jgi:hypothetical protein